MSQSRFFQRFRSSPFLNQFNIRHNHAHSLSPLNSTFLRLGKTTALLSCGLLLGYTVHQSLALADSPCQHGTVYSWGFNRYGQLGVGSESNALLPTAIPNLSNIIQISCGSEQTAALTSDGKVYTFGRGQDARLGHGETSGSNETYPRLVEELVSHNVVYVDAGKGSHMAAVTDKGEVFTWGKNTHSQLGHTRKCTSHYPTRVDALADLGVRAVKVSCGRYHTVVLADDGRVFAWGGWKSGETGTGNKRTTPLPTQVANLGDSKVIDVSAGQDFTLFLTSKGELLACGAGDQGQTGQGSSTRRYMSTPEVVPALAGEEVVRMCAGQFHSICCTREGRVYTFGLNREGQLGHGDTQNRTVPTGVMEMNEDDGRRVVDVAAGGGHSAMIVEEKGKGRQLYVFGRGRHGQMIVEEKGKGRQLYVFGRGRHGQMGRGDAVGSVAANRTEPVVVGFFDGLKQGLETVVLGTNHSAVLCCDTVGVGVDPRLVTTFD